MLERLKTLLVPRLRHAAPGALAAAALGLLVALGAALGVSAAVIIAIYLLRRPLARVAVLPLGALVPIAVAASRLELGVHWPTDVIAGLALGATGAPPPEILATARLWARPLGPTRGTARCRLL